MKKIKLIVLFTLFTIILIGCSPQRTNEDIVIEEIEEKCPLCNDREHNMLDEILKDSIIKEIILLENNSKLSLYNNKENEKTWTILFENDINDFVYSKDKIYISENSLIKILDINTGNLSKNIQLEVSIDNLNLNKKENKLFLNNQEKIFVLNLNDELIKQTIIPKQRIKEVLFEEENELLYVLSDNYKNIFIYDTKSFELLNEIKTNDIIENFIIFNDYIAFTQKEKQEIILKNIKDLEKEKVYSIGKEIHTLELNERKIIFSNNIDNTLSFIDLETESKETIILNFPPKKIKEFKGNIFIIGENQKDIYQFNSIQKNSKKIIEFETINQSIFFLN